MSVAVRRALPLDLYPPLPRRGDDIERIELCACGGAVIQWCNQPVTEAVREHNATPAHLAWRDGR